jgi:hypothetical protein
VRKEFNSVLSWKGVEFEATASFSAGSAPVEETRRSLEILGIDLPVAVGPSPVLIAMLQSTRGLVELR